MSTSIPSVPRPVNEPVRGYLPGSPERASLQRELALQAAEVVEIPCVINGIDVYSGNTVAVTMPSAHGGGPDRAGGAAWPTSSECQG